MIYQPSERVAFFVEIWLISSTLIHTVIIPVPLHRFSAKLQRRSYGKKESFAIMKKFDWYRNPDKLCDPKTGTDVIFLKEDDTELHLCKRAKPRRGGEGKLFCSNNKRWFHLHADGQLTEIQHLFSPAMRTPGRQCYNGKRGCSYPNMRDFSEINCHILVFEAWIGERDTHKEIDHKNGDVLDYSVENLEQVTRLENAWRSIHVLQVLRAKGFAPKAYSGADMDKWFAIFRALEMADRKPKELPAEELKALFDKYELADPAKVMEDNKQN